MEGASSPNSTPTISLLSAPASVSLPVSTTVDNGSSREQQDFSSLKGQHNYNTQTSTTATPESSSILVSGDSPSSFSMAPVSSVRTHLHVQTENVGFQSPGGSIDGTPYSAQPSASPQPFITPGMSARDRMAARMAAAKLGSFAVSRAAYDAAIRTGATPQNAQLAADEAVRQEAIASGKPPPPVRSVSSPEEEDQIPMRTPSLRSSVSESGSAYPPYIPAPSEAAAIPQKPNAVSAELQKSTRVPHLPGRSEAEWAARDAQFMHALCYGVASAQGERAHMEDEHRVVPHFDKLIRICNPVPAKAASSHASSIPAAVPGHSPSSPSSNHPHRGEQAFFGIYDGHGGREAAEFVRDHLHLNIAKRMAPPPGQDAPPDLGEAMKLGAADTEAALLKNSIIKQSQAGAVVAYTIFNGMQVYVAHAGDSRAVLCREGVAMDLTQDHKPGLESEQGRVAALGGFISEGCVNGEISVSRALGDVNLETGRKMLGLSADVALSKFYLTDEDEFVIIACDGLFDVMNSAAAVSYARHQLSQHNDIQRCANELVQQALRQQSTDNISVIVIGFMRTSPDGEPLIVPRDQRKVGGLNRANRTVVPPRPQRLQLNKGGLENLMKALEIPERPPQESDGDEEEQEEEG